MSTRYHTIVALLDDPLNRTIFEREYLRRKRGAPFKPLLPPIPVSGGGWAFPTFRESLRRARPDEYPAGATIDSEFDVYSDGEGWFIHTSTGNLEVGPFDSPAEALLEAREIAASEGFTLLQKVPWDDADGRIFPL